MKYLSRFKVTSVAACIDRAKQQEHGYGWFKLPNYHQGAVVYDLVIPQDEQYFHNGLGIDVVIQADSMENASRIGNSAAHHIFSLITFCTNTETSLPQERLLLEYGDDMEERNLRQFSPPFDETPTIGTVREIDEDIVFSLYDVIHSKRITESDRRKIIRALDRYASALRQQTRVDQFMWFYIALDALEELFVSHYDLSATREHVCEHCGEINEGPHHNAGKAHFLEQQDRVPIEYPQLRDIRGELFHGGTMQGAAERVEELASAVRLGLLEILDVPIDKYEEIIENDINGHLRDELMSFTGAISGYEPLPLDQFLNQPTVDLNRQAVEFDIVGDQIRRTPRENFSVDLPDGQGLEYIGIGHRPIGNIGKPDVSNVDFEVEAGD